MDVDVPDLPPGWVVTRAVVVVEALDEEGGLCLGLRISDDAPAWVVLGMLRAAAVAAEADMGGSFIDEDEDGAPADG